MQERVNTGIEGLDEMLGGGIPANHTIVLMGAFGTGKTTFGLQFLNSGLVKGEKGIYLTLEEDVDSILKTAELFNWDFRTYVAKDMLGVHRLDPTDAKNSVIKVRSELPQIIKNMKMKRVVVDSVSLLSLLYPDENERRTGLFNLCKMFKSTGATTILTAEVKDDNPRVSRDGLVEYTADGVILLEYKEERGEVKLYLRIVKMRHVPHARGIKPYDITDGGIVVHSKAEHFG